MQQLIILQRDSLASFRPGKLPDQTALLLLCAPIDLDDNELSALAEYSLTVYWLCSEAEVLPFGQPANYDKWADLSVQYARSFFWPV